MKKRVLILSALALAALLWGILSSCTPPTTRTEEKDVSNMTDEEIYNALSDQYFINLDLDNLSELSDVQLTVAISLALDAEVNNGGLCQFFINAPWFTQDLSACLERLGAAKTKESFDGFVADSGIDVTCQEREVSIEAFLELYEAYPWNTFDSNYTDEVSRKLVAYGQTHWDELFS